MNLFLRKTCSALILALLALQPSSCRAKAVARDGFAREPYILFEGTGSILLNWQTAEREECRVEWGPGECRGLRIISREISDDHRHRQILRGLPSGTELCYRVISPKGEFRGKFTMPPAGGDRLGFIASGDTRTDGKLHDRLAAAMLAVRDKNPGRYNLLLHTGDWVSRDSEAAWQEEFFDPGLRNLRALYSTLPAAGCIGNHEGPGDFFSKYFPFSWEQPFCRSFDAGPAHIVLFDLAHLRHRPLNTSSPRLAWLKRDLEKTGRKWKILLCHVPLYSAGGKHDDPEDIRNLLTPILERHGVQLVLSGHNHYYARVTAGTITHITTGAGGAPLYVPDPKLPGVKRALSATHFCAIDIEGDVLTGRALSPDGAELDRFVIKLKR